MPQPNRKRYRLSEIVTEVTAERPPIEIEADGQTFTVPPPELWPDVAIEQATTDPIAAARALLGDQYDAYRQAGGSAALLFYIVQKESGVPVGESGAS